MKKTVILIVSVILICAVSVSFMINEHKFEDSLESKEFLMISEDMNRVLRCELFDDNEIEQIYFDGLKAEEYYSICSDSEGAIWVAVLQNGKIVLAKTVNYTVIQTISLNFAPVKIAYYNNGIVASEINGNIYFIDVTTGEIDLLKHLSYTLDNASYCAGGFATDGTHLCWIDEESLSIMSNSEIKSYEVDYTTFLVFGGFYDEKFFFYHQDYISEENYYLYSIDINTGKLLKILTDDRSMTDENFFIDEKQIVTFYDPESWTEKIYVRDLETLKEKKAFVPNDLCGTMPQFSPGKVVIL